MKILAGILGTLSIIIVLVILVISFTKMFMLNVWAGIITLVISLVLTATSIIFTFID